MSHESKHREHRVAAIHRLQLEVIVGETVSVATLRVDDVVGFGEAKRLPGDVWSEKVGGGLAIARALTDAGEQLLERYDHNPLEES